MSSSFFTAPASQKKRKRPDDSAAKSTKRRSVAPPSKNQSRRNRPDQDDASISGSESDDSTSNLLELNDIEDHTSSSEDEGETAAERRLRLAERYLDNIKGEFDPAGFDAAEIDRDLIAERLKEDTAESKGKIYRHITSDFDFSTAAVTPFSCDQFCPTSVAVAPPYAYTVAKDLSIAQWELVDPYSQSPTCSNMTPRRKPRLVKKFAGKRSRPVASKYLGHTGAILCIAASTSGKFLATGGEDRKLVIWDAKTLKPLRIFTQHRDAVQSLSFRRNSHQLFTASADRTIKTWSIDDMTYVETLFGHQDKVADVVGLAQERCVSVGARDRTARYWKVIEESQLVFRGGGVGGSKDVQSNDAPYAEGSIDRIAMIDEDLFLTGSDNGSISLWNVQRKKPVYIIPLAHGVDPPVVIEESADKDPRHSSSPRPAPRWITALATIPYSDLIISGSWDGQLRIWKISEDKRRLESVGVVSTINPSASPVNGLADGQVNGHQTPHGTHAREQPRVIRGLINDITVFERGERGKDGLCIVAVVSKQHRLGKWVQGDKWRCEAVVVEVPKKAVQNGDADNHDNSSD